MLANIGVGHRTGEGEVLMILHAVDMRLLTSHPNNAEREHAGLPPDRARRKGRWEGKG